MNRIYSFLLGAFLITNTVYAADRKTVSITWNGNNVTVKGDKIDSLTVKVSKSRVVVENLIEADALTFVLSGKSDAGSFEYKGKHKAYFELNNLTLNSTDSIPINLKNGKNSIIILKNNNSLSVSADTLDGAFIRTKGKLTLEGPGSLTMKSATVGCKGLKVGEDFIMNGGNVSIETSGRFIELNNNPFGGFGGFPGFGGGDGEMPDFGGFGGFPGFGGGDGQMPDFGGFGGFPGFGGGDGQMPDFGGFGGFPGFGGRHGDSEDSGDDDDMMFKQKVNGSTKGVRAAGTVTVNGGKLTIRTSTYAAEGLEGKKGITINGGEIDIIAKDDAINSNGPIVFNGGKVRAVSKQNDAVDSNTNGEGAITINGGDIEVVSLIGAPEEGFDSDFNAMVITGGRTFSVGGAMAGSPSAPNTNTAKQPTLLINGIDIKEGTDVLITDNKGKEILRYTPKYSLDSSHSLITSPDFKKGQSYKVVVNGETLHEFTFTDNFVTIGNAGGGFGGFGGFGGGFPGGGFGGPGGGFGGPGGGFGGPGGGPF